MKITPWFDSAEFECHDGTPVPPELHANRDLLVLGVLHPLRERVGRLIVISGYRTRAYNARVGGAGNSSHMTCEAADVRPARFEDIEMLHDVALEMRKAGQLPALGGIGHYPGRWIHLDVRKAADGHLRRWVGAGVGSEQ